VGMKQEAVRTTVEIPVGLYRKLKERPAPQGRSVRDLILAGVRTSLLEASARGQEESDFP
jgi:hypothetical protein